MRRRGGHGGHGGPTAPRPRGRDLRGGEAEAEAVVLPFQKSRDWIAYFNQHFPNFYKLDKFGKFQGQFYQN